MTVFRSGDDIFHTDESRVVWSTSRRPAVLLPEAATVLTSFDIAFPDFAKNNAYAFDLGSTTFGSVSTCLSMVTIVPQQNTYGPTAVATLPASANYFEVSVNLVRVGNPSTWLGVEMPKSLAEGRDVLLDGNSAVVERVGPLARIFWFERSGNTVNLYRKQSVADLGARVPWTPGNALYYPNGGWREGWTHGGNAKGWPAHVIETRGPGGAIDKKRDGSNACSLSDPTNYASTWRGTVTITPGYIVP